VRRFAVDFASLAPCNSRECNILRGASEALFGPFRLGGAKWLLFAQIEGAQNSPPGFWVPSTFLGEKTGAQNSPPGVLGACRVFDDRLGTERGRSAVPSITACPRSSPRSADFPEEFKEFNTHPRMSAFCNLLERGGRAKPIRPRMARMTPISSRVQGYPCNR
jgi:hypothetical protein